MDNEYTCPHKINDIVAIYGNNETRFGQITYKEELPRSSDLVFNAGALADGASSNSNKMTILEMDHSDSVSELGYFFMECLDPIMCTLRQPASNSRFGTKNNNIRTDMTSGAVQLNSFNGETILLNVDNESGQELKNTRIQFWGTRLVLQNLTQQAALQMAQGKDIPVLVASGLR